MSKSPFRVAFGLGVIKSFSSDSAFEAALGASPKVGDIYINNSDNIYRYYSADGWQSLSPRLNRALVNYFDVGTVLTPTGHQTIDGSLTVNGDLVLLSTHSTTKGIYEASTGLWTLVSPLTATNGSPVNGDSVWVQSGSTYGLTQWTYNGSIWVNSEISAGTVNNSTLYWDGSAWVENTSILSAPYSVFGPDDAAADSVKANNLSLTATNKVAGTGDGGDLILSGGASTGGLNGDVRLQGSKVRLDVQQASDPLVSNITDVYYNTTENRFKYYDGTNWRPMGGGGGAYPVSYVDNSSTSLPAVAPYSPDGTAVVTGDEVLFSSLTTLADRGVWKATVVALVVTWQRVLHGQSPTGLSFDGDFVWIKFGSANADSIYVCTDTPAATWIDYANLIGVGIIGTAEDGVYTDGLFTDFVPTTPIGVAVDRFNEILKALAPAPAPTLYDMSMAQSGVASKLSFGTSNAIAGYSNVTVAGGGAAVNINGNFDVSGNRKGAFGTSTTTFSGTLADAVVQGSGSPNPAYPAKSFGNANQGFLRLYVNGVQVHQVNLSSFGSGSSVNANGSGFNLSAANNALFPDGTPLDLFKNRTGTWTVNVADCGLGMNYFQVEHFITGSALTQKYDLIRDTNAVAMTASGNSLGTLVMAGSKRLSGVNYHTSGTAAYGVTVANAYRNIYSQSPISYTATNCSVPNQTIPSMATEADNITISGAVATVTNSGRLLNASISVGVNVPHPLKTALSNAGNSSISGILLDNISTASTDLVENFDSENIRMKSIAAAGTNNYAAQADVSAGNAWDSTQSLTAGTAGHLDGLLYENSAARYPTQGTNGGNYAGITNGPAGNVNYSAATGDRFVYMKFRNNTGLTKANFTITFQGASTTFVDTATALTGNNMRVEMKFPNGSLSTATGWMDCYKDFATGLWADGDGARFASNGAGRALATTWGITVGTKSIAANEWIMVRFSVGSSWTGNISSLTVAWL
jgi:hypothetical protein